MPLALLTIPDWLPWLLMAGGGAVVVAVIVWIAVSKRRPITTDTPAARFARAKQRAAEQSAPPANSARDQQSARDAMIEVKEIADAVATELDEKAAQLERLIKLADDRIAELQRLHARAAPSSGTNAPGSGGGPAARSNTSRDEHDQEAQDPMTARVIALAEQGLSPVQIAQRTGQGVGTIELILALRR